MADEIRCPMCSKNNPPGTETCRFCGARISAVGQAGSDEPDWLRDFRDSSGGSAEGSALPWQNSGEADSSSGLPDWLTAGSDAAQDSGPDLLGRLSGEEKSPESTPGYLHGVEPDEPATPSERPDWLNGFRAGDETGDMPAASEPAQPTAANLPPAAGTDDEVINWLKSLGDEAPGDLFTDAPVQPPDTLAWSEESITDTKNQQTGVTEWLENMAHESPAKPAATPESEQRFQDWLSSDGLIRADQPPVNLPAETRADVPQELPDWLSGAPDQDAGAAAEAASQPEEELPAWLSSFSAAETAESDRDLSAVSPDAGQPLAAAELPDWLSEVASTDASMDANADALGQTAQPAASGEELSDWLSAISEPEPVEPEPAAPSLDIPDFSILFAEEKAASEEQLSPEMFGEAPAEPAVPLASAVQPAAETQGQSEPEAPDWLGAFGEAGKEEAVVTGGTGSLPFIDEGIPAWLNDVQPPSGPVSIPAAGSSALLDDTQQPQYEAASDEPFQVDLPDWLTDFQPGETESEAAAGEAEEESDLVHAELPGWVEDLRPIEAIVTGESVVAAAAAGAETGREEKLGPLAGMRGVLPGEESAVRFRKLPTYSARLRVSERQRSHAALLQNILDIEPIAKEIPAVPSQAPQYIYRLVIAAVLIVALLAGMIFTDLEIFPAPQPTANDTGLQTLFNQIESLPSGAPVLLAVDYEPGLSGEMQMAASSVIEHLMLRDVRLAIVSTVPSGPLLAEDLLNLVHPRKNEFDLATHVVNLGYLPGGTTSLLEFARRPSSAAPFAFDGSVVWNGPVLQGIQNIQSFALVLVLTDSAETGRAWVEQVQPLLGATPLSMVASAQAGPMLLPYHEAGQITGLVNGFLGGAMYEQRSGRVNLANVYWNSYQTGYLAGILMLILGGIFSAVLNAARKPRRPKA